MLKFTPARSVLALLGITLLTALTMTVFSGRAGAALYSEAELTASSSHGMVDVASGGPAAFREARSAEPIALNGVLYRYRDGIESTSAATMKFTVSHWCGWYAGGSTGSYPIGPVVGHYTWHPETLCPGEGLYQAVLTGYAYDPANPRNPTAQLRVTAYGPQVPDDMLPAWTPW
jgi:hypothetical protein